MHQLDDAVKYMFYFDSYNASGSDDTFTETGTVSESVAKLYA